ncbi:MAG: transposase [Bacteroidota bacterium]
MINGILWICRTGAPWKDMPSRYPTYQTCHRYFQAWNNQGLWDKILYSLASHLKEKGKIDKTLMNVLLMVLFPVLKKGG